MSLMFAFANRRFVNKAFALSKCYSFSFICTQIEPSLVCKLSKTYFNLKNQIFLYYFIIRIKRLKLFFFCNYFVILFFIKFTKSAPIFTRYKIYRFADFFWLYLIYWKLPVFKRCFRPIDTRTALKKAQAFVGYYNDTGPRCILN